MGEALLKSIATHTAVLWTLSRTWVATRQDALIPKLEDEAFSDDYTQIYQPMKTNNRRKIGKVIQQQFDNNIELCPKFNWKKGCERRERDCPLHKKRACSKNRNWRHGAANRQFPRNRKEKRPLGRSPRPLGGLCAQ